MFTPYKHYSFSRVSMQSNVVDESGIKTFCSSYRSRLHSLVDNRVEDPREGLLRVNETTGGGLPGSRKTYAELHFRLQHYT